MGTELREVSSTETYSLMTAPWGLLARVASSSTPTVPSGVDGALLDATVAMAFLTDLAARPGDAVIWSGSLVAPRGGLYRMAFAAEDDMRLLVDQRPVDVVTVKPDGWASVGLGSTVRLEPGSHAVQITLQVTHGGRELARWNWVPPLADGALDATSEWSVVPPQVLRPDPPVARLPAR